MRAALVFLLSALASSSTDCMRSVSTDASLRGLKSANGFGIYSCGPDGVTSSRGNDEDDLSTWNGGGSVYRAREMKQRTMRSATTIATIGVLIAAAVTMLATIMHLGRPRT